MKSFIISAALALLATTVSAAPASAKSETRQFAAQITFNGADPEAYFTQIFPADGASYTISKPYPILFSSILSASGSHAHK